MNPVSFRSVALELLSATYIIQLVSCEESEGLTSTPNNGDYYS